MSRRIVFISGRKPGGFWATVRRRDRQSGAPVLSCSFSRQNRANTDSEANPYRNPKSKIDVKYDQRANGDAETHTAPMNL
jgi:hypothetical protein